MRGTKSNVARREKTPLFSRGGENIGRARITVRTVVSFRCDRNVTATCIQGEYDLVNFTRMKGFSRPPSLGIIPDARNIYIYTYIFRWNLDIRFLIILSKFDPFRFLYALSSVDCVARIGSMQAFENYDFNRVRTSPPSSFPQWHFSRLEFQLRRGITDERFEEEEEEEKEEWSVIEIKPPNSLFPNSLPSREEGFVGLKTGPSGFSSSSMLWREVGVSLGSLYAERCAKQRCHFDRGVLLEELRRGRTKV